MQVLKEEIREKIIDTATRLFYERGFEETSMRQIAQGVDMSASNLYKYFKNKEDIFNDIVKGCQAVYIENIKQIISHEHKDDSDQKSNMALIQALFNVIKTDHVKFVLLMDKSKGTKYAGLKNDVASQLVAHILRDISVTGRQEHIAGLLVRNFMGAIVEVAKDYRDDEWVSQNLGLLVQYHMNGMKALYEL